MKKYQVFISSTYTDLMEERRNVINILLSTDCIPAGMEIFVATDDEQFNVIKKVIDLCDYYILIIGKRYGQINEKSGLSYTEMEYDYAISKKIPVLVFALDDNVSGDSDNFQKLKTFKEKAMKNRLASIWKNEVELAGKVAVSISRAKDEIPRAGWQPVTQFNEVESLRKIVELQELLAEQEKDIDRLNELVQNMKTNPDLAYEDGNFEIPYFYYFKGTMSSNRSSGKIQTNFKEVFEYISKDILNVSVSESHIEQTLNRFIASKNGVKEAYCTDYQIVKKLLIQYEGLNLMYSQWSTEKKQLHWGLTLKGQQVRNEATWVKRNSKEINS